VLEIWQALGKFVKKYIFDHDLVRKTIRDFAPHENLIEYVTDRAGHDFRYAIDCSKIQKELGWKPSVSFEEGIGKTVEWFLSRDS
jgi:dTDP-glucose 4,6-dehydratase